MTAPTAANPRTAPGYRDRFSHGFFTTDDVLLSRALSITEKLVLAATTARPSRDPSLTYLEAWVPGSRRAIAKAQNRLEDVFAALTYDRPTHEDRDALTRRFRHSNRAMTVAPWADPTRPENQRRRVSLSMQIIKRLPRGTKNSGACALLALFYAREQLRRGAIHVPDAVAAGLLGLSVRQVERSREALIACKVLEKAKKAEGVFIYTMPNATARDADVNGLDVSRTRLLRPLPVDFGDPIYVYANDAEWAMIQARLAKMPPVYHALAVMKAHEKMPPKAILDDRTIPVLPGSGIPLSVDAMLEGIMEALHLASAQQTHKGRSGHWEGAVQDTVSSLPPTTKIKSLRADAREASTESEESLPRPRRFNSTEQAATLVLEELKPDLQQAVGRERTRIVTQAVNDVTRRSHARTDAQVNLITDAARAQLTRITGDDERERFAQLTKAMDYLRENDELYAALKAARPTARGNVLDHLEAELGPTFAPPTENDIWD